MSAPFPSPTKKWHSNTYDTLSPTRPELSAAGKTILITGGGSGIGAETARYFAAAGASRIALLGRRAQPLHDTKASIHEKYPNVDVFTAAVDVSVQEEANKAFAEFLEKDATKRTIDVLVSNAALTGPMESVEAVDPTAFLSAVQKNIKLALYTAQAFLRYASPNAVVINVSSSAAHVNFADKFAAYSVAKLAAYRLWDSLAFGKPDMRVYHIQPGVVDTDMNKEASGVKAMGFEDHVSLPASFTLWLASPEAAFLRGKFLWANWDVDELKAHAQEIEASTKFNIGLGGWSFNDAGFDSKAQIGNWS